MANKYFSKKLSKSLKPPCDLTMYDNEEYMKNPLLKFRIQDVRERRHMDCLKQKAVVEKMKIAREPLVYLEPIRRSVKEECEDQMRKPVKMESPRMSTTLENRAISFICKNLKRRNSESIESCIENMHAVDNKQLKVGGVERSPDISDESAEEDDLISQHSYGKVPVWTSKFDEGLTRNNQKLTKNDCKKKVKFPKINSKTMKKGSRCLGVRQSFFAK